MDEESLLDLIYEAATLPDRWPALLGQLSMAGGAMSGLLLAQTEEGLHGHECGGLGQHRIDYDAQGWIRDTTRMDWLLRSPYPGFRTDLDFATVDELNDIPVYRDFLIPRGIQAGAATLVSGLDGDQLLISFEAFDGHEEARAAVPLLDRLRPHIARAAMLSARLRAAEARAAVEALDIAGIGAALLTVSGKIRAANARFEARLGSSGPLHAATLSLEQRLRDIAAQPMTQDGRSLILGGETPIVLHLLPIRGAARDIFTGCSMLAVIAEEGGQRALDGELVRLLYDLTPAEARIADRIAAGHRVDSIAAREGIAISTVRSHLKTIFSKTGVHSQTELAQRLTPLRHPAASPNR